MRTRLSRRWAAASSLAAVVVTTGCAVGPGGSSGSTAVQNYPSAPVEIVVPYNAGGATDQAVRVLTKPVGDVLGDEPLVVLNQAGGAGTIGTTRVVAATPDGYTLGFVAGGPLTLQPHYGRTVYSWQDVTPIARVSTAPIVLAVPADSPLRTVDDLVRTSREKPGSVRYASTGAGNPANLAMEKLNTAAGIKTTQVPFESSAEAVTAVLGKNVEAAAGSPSGFTASVKSGSLRLLANLGSVRGEGYENIPTLKEAGYDVATDIRSGFIAPAGLPDELLRRVSSAIQTVLARPEVRRKIELTGAVPDYGGPEEYRRDIAEEFEETRKVLRDAGLI